MKKIISIIITAISFLSFSPLAQAGTFGVNQGGTGSTSWTTNYILLGNGTSPFLQVSTSSLGLTSSLSTNPFQATYFQATSTTATSTFPIASTTILYSNAGTVALPSIQVTGNEGLYQSGVGVLGLSNGVAGLSWDGTSFYPNTNNARNIGSASDIWNNGYIATLTLTNALTVANGGTGDQTISQGWLYSSGSTAAITSSTSPTVGYITATSNATSTFTGSVNVTNGTVLVNDLVQATSTSMNIFMASSSSITVRLGTATNTITLASSSPGDVLRIFTCNPPTGTAGTTTWAANPYYIHWSGTTVPTQTLTANACDLWTFAVTSGTSTPFIFGAQIPY